nr:granulocyte-macrophage colony-stimulating factor receptor subunit alpha-like isoform X1 [Pelodiscus sinensis]XP_014435370.1 granulocyte-macrophage colony-stimulating factor receptor subunit alpha-like isoform X1 [Pelodiscus sinensis]XP_025033614.1 granulocyte-macrophage colony-stimulating factor receptor subunit alpha-like isoform X1 [Pelodiscus sinensis]|eukprot:XP_006135917.2 granulocyte-macrophage colony-stimulating factor receptor subunit alpha-like isoform X1 [Pelodiscus sinensis]
MTATFRLVSMIWRVLFFLIWCADYVNTKMMPSSSPIANLTFSHTKLQLTWDSSITDIDYNCYMETSQDYIEKEASNKTCIFSRPIHMGAKLGVKGTYNGTEYSEEIRFIPPGKNGTRVENFSCVIYNISFMNCTWDAGRKAPINTQYCLSLQYPSEKDALKCPHYIKDALGRHISCSFQNVTIIKDPVYFLVKGDSNELEIQFYDEFIKLYEIEKLTPPVNITVNCSEDQPRCIVQWKRPQLSHEERDIDQCFEYEIDIRNKKTNANPEENKNEPHTAQGTSFTFENYNVKKKYSLKIRAKGDACLISKKWGEWSEPIDFGNTDGAALMYPIVLLLIAIGTILVALLIFFLCKRCCNLKKMFPPVPQPKNKFYELQKEGMDPPLTKYETEEITTVEEVA